MPVTFLYTPQTLHICSDHFQHSEVQCVIIFCGSLYIWAFLKYLLTNCNLDVLQKCVLLFF